MTVQEKLINKEYDFLIVGAGISGIVMAERLASVGKKILLIDKRDHFGGNCFDYKEKGIMVQKYGPHIFHTKYLEVFKYLSGFTRWNSYRHKVLAWHNKRLYPMPINRTTLNRFFDLDLKDETEVRKFLATKKVRFGKIKNAEDFILSRFGEELNEAFFKHYSRKVWGVSLDKIDSSVVRRLPIRYDDNDLYFNDEQQGLPTPSFSAMFAKMLGNKNITVKLKTDYFEISDQIRYKTLIFTGEIDRFFNYKFGRLNYRRLHFSIEKIADKSFQENSVINYPAKKTSLIRITEFKKLYLQKGSNTVICREYPSKDGVLSYPVENYENKKILQKYLKQEKTLGNVYFLGRLGRFKYIDMSQAVKDALDLFDKINKNDSR